MKNNPHNIQPELYVWVLPLDRRRSSRGGAELAEVEKVGKKYFTLKGYHRTKFHLDTLRQDSGGYSPSYRIYVNIQDYNNEQELGKLKDKCRKAFDIYSCQSFTLDQLRRMAEIIDEQSPSEG